jgi:hypothetical protein
MNAFTKAYVDAMLWAETDDDGEPLDANYAAADLHPDALAKAERDCDKFLADNAEWIGGDYGQAGHDFWLTRNGHGVGFWDGDWPEDAGERLTTAAEAFGECNVYVGDDGKLHLA